MHKIRRLQYGNIDFCVKIVYNRLKIKTDDIKKEEMTACSYCRHWILRHLSYSPSF